MKIWWYWKSQKKANDELLWRSLYLQLRKHTGPGDVTSALPTEGYVWKSIKASGACTEQGQIVPMVLGFAGG